MEKTLHIDAAILREAKQALIRQAAYQRLRALRGTEKRAADVPRRREAARPFLSGRAPFAGGLDRLLDVGWGDAHVLVAGAPLWTADERLARIALDLRIAHRPRA